MGNDDSNILETLTQWEHKADNALSNAILCLKKLTNRLSKNAVDEDTAVHLYQLTLQYRLDCEDIIKSLLTGYKNVCGALGLNPSNSMTRNLDVAAYHLGKDNLRHELSILHNLSGKLLKALSLAQKTAKAQVKEKQALEKLMRALQDNGLDKEQNLDLSKDKASRFRTHKKEQATLLINDLNKAINRQAYFSFAQEQLTGAVLDIGHVPKFGIIYDYLAGLKGPISRYQVALQNGIALSDGLLKTLGESLKLSHKHTSEKHQVHALSKQLSDTFALQKQLLIDSSNRLQSIKEMTAKVAPTPIRPKPKPEGWL